MYSKPSNWTVPSSGRFQSFFSNRTNPEEFSYDEKARQIYAVPSNDFITFVTDGVNRSRNHLPIKEYYQIRFLNVITSIAKLLKSYIACNWSKYYLIDKFTSTLLCRNVNDILRRFAIVTFCCLELYTWRWMDWAFDLSSKSCFSSPISQYI